jgi:hypothetical protein
MKGKIAEYVDNTGTFKLDVTDPSYYSFKTVKYDAYHGELRMERRQFQAFLQFLNEVDLEVHK